ncbi:MAG: metalloprotease PmbA [Gammaproteobacteria bacterium]|nr:metalloprotease PmbA [Gammaproteobacteria bacterium]NNF62585.1 metalloprotease PmbA [Gammaproteobacteria bacterium]NNM19843.1 metalloprotease PmbA [Gammaproteobacteria bacterium]
MEQAVRRVLDLAVQHGASQAEAAVSAETGLSVTARLGDVETLEYHSDRGVGVTVYFGQRKASASSADLSAEALEQTVAKAVSIARYTAEDPCAGLADAQLMAADLPDLDLSHPWELAPERAIELAIECEQSARDVDKRITNSEGASINSHQGVRVYGNSHGFLGGYPSTSHSISCAVVASDDAGMERDYWYDSARCHDDLLTPAEIGRQAGERTVRRLGARKIDTVTAPVLFPPELARGMIGHYLAAVRGTVQYRQASFLLDIAGQQVFPEFMQLSERPHLLRAPGSRPMDNEGVATQDRELVADGVAQGYILSSYSARKLGLQTTGNAGGIHNLLVKPSTSGGLAELMQQMGSGLLIGELMGQGVNAVTGDYSRGAAGFWVEDGKISFPVHEITIAGNLRDMFRNIVAVGDDVDARGRVRCGSMLLEQMTIAGA